MESKIPNLQVLQRDEQRGWDLDVPTRTAREPDPGSLALHARRWHLLATTCTPADPGPVRELCPAAHPPRRGSPLGWTTAASSPGWLRGCPPSRPPPPWGQPWRPRWSTPSRRSLPPGTWRSPWLHRRSSSSKPEDLAPGGHSAAEAGSPARAPAAAWEAAGGDRPRRRQTPPQPLDQRADVYARDWPSPRAVLLPEVGSRYYSDCRRSGKRGGLRTSNRRSVPLPLLNAGWALKYVLTLKPLLLLAHLVLTVLSVLLFSPNLKWKNWGS